MKNMRKKNSSIDLLRLLFAVDVVAQHIPIYLGQQLKEQPFWFFMTSQLSRVAVSFFFVVSGYFYFKALLAGKDVMKKYLNKMLVTYTIWFVIYLPINLYDLICNQKRGVFSCLFSLFGKYFIFGSYYQLWYMPILFLAIILVGFSAKAGKIKYIVWLWTIFYLAGLIIKFPFFLNISIYSKIETIPYYFMIDRIFLSGIPMFMLGYWINRFEKMIGTLCKQVIWTSFGIVSVALCFFSFLDKGRSVLGNFCCGIAVPIWLVLLLSLCFLYPANCANKISAYVRSSSGFLYYIHPIILMMLSKLCIEANGFLFLVIPLLISLICCYFIMKGNNKYVMKLL